MKAISRLAGAGAVGGLLLALSAAANPVGLAAIENGLWEVSRKGADPVRLCIADPATLAQFEHRSASCTRDLVRNASSGATIQYSCAAAGFGHSTITVLTPRSLRIETQGISASAPFRYVFHARRVGNCTAH